MLNRSVQVERVSCARLPFLAYVLAIFATLTAMCGTRSASAADTCQDQTTDGSAEAVCNFQKQLWLNPGFISLHFTKIEERNPLNLGLGAEWRLTEETALIAGTYVNSVRKQSTYGGVSWQPLTLGVTQLGAAVGLIRGYPNSTGATGCP
jgi:hypothetical protein